MICIVKEGSYYSDLFHIEFACKFKKRAIKKCRRDGYKHNRKQDLWGNESTQLWRRIELVRFVE
jgi:hypothetical protein